MRTRNTKPWELSLFALVGMSALLTACVGPVVRPVSVNGKALLGLTQERLHACAGAPLHELPRTASTLLVYYREAAMFEESAPGSLGGGKGSRPGYHHGCWATLMIEEGRVTGVEFRPVPDPDADTHECQEIFVVCAS